VGKWFLDGAFFGGVDFAEFPDLFFGLAEYENEDGICSAGKATLQSIKPLGNQALWAPHQQD
jgi:hypothetical protein